MGKLKRSRCAGCHQKIGRHDAARFETRLGEGSDKSRRGRVRQVPGDDTRPVLTYHLAHRP